MEEWQHHILRTYEMKYIYISMIIFEKYNLLQPPSAQWLFFYALPQGKPHDEDNIMDPVL